MIRGKKTQTNARGAEECRKSLWDTLVALFSGRGFTQSGTSEAPSSPISQPEWHKPKWQSSLSPWPMHHSNHTACPGPGWVVPGVEGGSFLLRTRTDNQDVPREPPSSCPSPCLSCGTANPHPNACLLFSSKKPPDQVRLQRLQQKRASTCTSLPTNAQNYSNKQIQLPR